MWEWRSFFPFSLREKEGPAAKRWEEEGLGTGEGRLAT